MVRTYKTKNAYLQWTEEGLKNAIRSVLEGHLNMRGAAAQFKIPFTTIYRRVRDARLHRGMEKNNSNHQVSPPLKKRIGHPTVLSAEQERDLVERLKNLSNRGLGHTSLTSMC